MRFKHVMFIILSVIGTTGTVGSGILFVSAISFSELGRALVYFVIGALCIELTVFAIYRAFCRKE